MEKVYCFKCVVDMQWSNVLRIFKLTTYGTLTNTPFVYTCTASCIIEATVFAGLVGFDVYQLKYISCNRTIGERVPNRVLSIRKNVWLYHRAVDNPQWAVNTILYIGLKRNKDENAGRGWFTWTVWSHILQVSWHIPNWHLSTWQPCLFWGRSFRRDRAQKNNYYVLVTLQNFSVAGEHITVQCGFRRTATICWFARI